MRVVSVNDPAIDRHSFNGQRALRRYIESRDMADLVFLDGQQPTVFTLQPIAFDARTWIEGLPAESAQFVLAFACSVVKVEDPDEGELALGEATSAAWGPFLSTKAVARLGDEYGGKLVEEIGAVALQAANMTAAQKKAFWLPRGCAVDYRIGIPATEREEPSIVSDSQDD